MSSPAAKKAKHSPEAAAESYNKANELWVDEQYNEALVHYNNAIASNPTVAAYFLKRAQARLKLEKFSEAIVDCESCIKLDPYNALANFRKGVAHFHIEEFLAAQLCFEEAQKLGHTTDDIDLWLRKCLAERKQSMPATPSTSTPNRATTSTSTSTSAPPTASTPAPAPTPAPASVAAPPPKVRENWFQSPTTVTVTLFAKNLPSDRVTVTFGEQTLDVRLILPDNTIFEKKWNLFAPIKSTSSYEVTAYKVDITMQKLIAGDWKKLEAVAPSTVVSRENTIGDVNKARYPSSSKRQVDWDEEEKKAKKDEEDEKPEGEAALHKLFQGIYSNANPDVQRAMMKSYQTSGGTVLSTNWAEVEKTDYTKNRQAPTGQEFRDWNDM